MTRVDGAEDLHMSMRTVDRYVRSGKIRAKKIGKIMYLHADDVEMLKQETHSQADNGSTHGGNSNNASDAVLASSHALLFARERIAGEMELLYREAKESSMKKDETIRELSYRLGTAENDLKNSVPVVEFKKTTFLLETAKSRAEEDREQLQVRVRKLEDDISSGMRYNLLLALFLAFLLIVVAVLWIRIL